jgi:hypothetical protein
MHLAIHPVKRFCQQRFTIHQPEEHLFLKPEAGQKIREHVSQEQKYAEMRERMARLKEKAMLA